jgi:streptogramin lyase
MQKKIQTVLIIFLMFICGTLHAQSCSNLYAVGPFSSTAEGTGGLVRLNPLTGEAIEAKDITLAGMTLSGATGMAVDPTDGRVYVVLKISATTGRRLATLDIDTGVATDIGPLTLSGDVENLSSITFDDTGQLWGVIGDGGVTTSETLVTVNKVNGEMTVQTALGNGDDGETIEYNSADGLIYHRSGNGDGDLIFETIDPNTLQINNIGLINDAGNEGFGLLFNPVTGLFYETNIDSELVTIDPSDGTMTVIGLHVNSDDLRGPILYPRPNAEFIFCNGFDLTPPIS